MRGVLIAAGVGVLAGAAFLAAPAFAYTSPGSPSGYVNDFAHVLSAETIQNLNAELSAFEASTSNQIAVVTVPNMGGDYIENYAVKLFAEWGIGKKDKDNGVLLLLSIGERKLRIEVGYGLEGALPDSVAQSIINRDMTPLLKAGDYDGAVALGVRGIEQATQGEYEGSGSQSDGDNDWIFALIFIPLIVVSWLAAILARSKSWWAGGVVGAGAGVLASSLFGLPIWMLALAALGLGAFGLGLDYLVSRAYTAAKTSGTTIPWWAGSGTHSSSSSSSGGGFGGFGGGSSGGGGASGGW